MSQPYAKYRQNVPEPKRKNRYAKAPTPFHRDLALPLSTSAILPHEIPLISDLHLQPSNIKSSPISKHAPRAPPKSISDDRNGTPKALDSDTRICNQDVLLCLKAYTTQTCSKQSLVCLDAYARANDLRCNQQPARSLVPRD